MTHTELALISFGLSMDCFAVAVTCGTSQKMQWKDIYRMAFLFGAFQGGMPLLGWFVGKSMQALIEPVDHWISFAILAAIGLKMVVQSFSASEEGKSLDVRKTAVLISLSIATSIDALITGVSFGFIQVNIVEAVFFISVITFGVSVAGARTGEKARFLPARWAEFGGGIVLIAIGLKVLSDHLHFL